jgi:hypothetical protein
MARGARVGRPYAAGVTDVLARVLALSGLTVSIGSLGWQFATYRLTGARVRCELRLALCTDSNPAGTLENLAERGDRLQWVLGADRDESPHEAALITVRNLGLTAVSVQHPGLLIGTHHGGEGTTRHAVGCLNLIALPQITQSGTSLQSSPTQRC